VGRPQVFLKRGEVLAGLGAAAAAALSALAARRIPVGAFNDDAANVLLSRSLLTGHYAFPQVLGAPHEYLPGMPLLLALPAKLLAPHWGLLRLLPLLSAWLCAFFAWRLARRHLSAAAAGWAGFLVALNPVFVGLGGVVGPYFPYAAVSLLVFGKLDDGPSAKRFWSLVILAAFAALLRPHGGILIASAALALLTESPARAAAFAALSSAPIAAWTLWTRLGASTSDYPSIWRAQVASLGEPGAQLAQARRILRAVFADGWGIAESSNAAKELAAVALLLAAAAGTLAVLKRKKSPAVFAMAAYAIATVALHMTWPWVQTKYAIPLIPVVWILALAAFERRPAAVWALGGFFALVALRYDLAYAVRGLRGRATFQPQTMAWLKRETPPDARVETLKNYSVMLLAERPALPRPLNFREPELWLAHAQATGASYVHFSGWTPDEEFSLPDVPGELESGLAGWLAANKKGTVVFGQPVEGTAVFHLPAKRP
jgi:hypothetical protein